MSKAAAAASVAVTGRPSTSNSPQVVRTGTLNVRERSAFGGRAWKAKGVVLDEQSLTIHQPSSSRQIRLPLSSITELERTDLMPHSLGIKCAGKMYHLAFDTDGDLYDWRDDMYSRCPLGAQASTPFNFQHTAHIGSTGATGTFAEPTTLPLYEEMMGRPKPSTAVTGMADASPAAAVTTRTRSPQATAARRRSNPPNGNVILKNNNNVNFEGAYFIKQTGMFAGWYWKERWLSLKGDSLTVHTRKTKASPPAKEIPLSTIKNVEPDSKRSNSLLVTTTRRETCINILFNTDNELYAWREAIYLRSGLSAVISPPTDFVHTMHVTFDEATGELKGLPDQWKALLYGAPSAHIVKLPLQPSNGNTNSANNSTGRSSRRRSQPPASSPFSNLARVPPPSSSADTEDDSPLAEVKPLRSPDSQFLTGASASTNGTLVGVSPHTPVLMSVMKGKTDELGPVRQ